MLADKGVVSRDTVDQIQLSERTAAADLDSARFGAEVADYEVELARAALGRALKRARQNGRAAEVLRPVAERCADPAVATRAAYVLATVRPPPNGTAAA